MFLSQILEGVEQCRALKKQTSYGASPAYCKEYVLSSCV